MRWSEESGRKGISKAGGRKTFGNIQAILNMHAGNQWFALDVLEMALDIGKQFIDSSVQSHTKALRKAFGCLALEV